MQGVPVRIDLGPRDLDAGTVTVVTRRGEKSQVTRTDLNTSLAAIVQGINGNLQKKAADHIKDHLTIFINDGSPMPDAAGSSLLRSFHTMTGVVQTG